MPCVSACLGFSPTTGILKLEKTAINVAYDYQGEKSYGPVLSEGNGSYFTRLPVEDIAGELEVIIVVDGDMKHRFVQDKKLLKKAHEHGSAIAIGHPYPETTDYLQKRLNTPLSAQLVTINQLLK